MHVRLKLFYLSSLVMLFLSLVQSMQQLWRCFQTGFFVNRSKLPEMGQDILWRHLFNLKKSQQNIVNRTLNSRTCKERHIRFDREGPGTKTWLRQQWHQTAGCMRRASSDGEHSLTIARANSISGWWNWKKLLQRKEAAKRANCCGSRC